MTSGMISQFPEVSGELSPVSCLNSLRVSSLRGVDTRQLTYSLACGRLLQISPSTLPSVVMIFHSEVEEMFNELEGRRLAREIRGGRITARCRACNRFMRNPKHRCGCGYLDGVGYAA